jgi:hypothetical protein
MFFEVLALLYDELTHVSAAPCFSVQVLVKVTFCVSRPRIIMLASRHHDHETRLPSRMWPWGTHLPEPQRPLLDVPRRDCMGAQCTVGRWS